MIALYNAFCLLTAGRQLQATKGFAVQLREVVAKKNSKSICLGARNSVKVCEMCNQQVLRLLPIVHLYLHQSYKWKSMSLCHLCQYTLPI